MSKNPLDLPKKTFEDKEVAQALRLAIIAELDAINLYEQLASAIKDEKIRRVFEDIAKEEKTHVGEFLALLKTIDKEQVLELKAGEEEVKELTGLEIPKNNPGENKVNTLNQSKETPEPFTEEEWSRLLEAFRKTLDESRILRHYIPLHRVGRGVDAILIEKIVDEKEKLVDVVKLEEVAVKFSIPQKLIDYARRYKDLNILPLLHAAQKIGWMEDELLLKKLLSEKDVIRIRLGDWTKPGQAVNDISKAIAELNKKGILGPFILFINPARYAELVQVHERTGVTELARIKALVNEVVKLPHIPENKALLIAPLKHLVDIVVGVDTEIEYIGPENGNHVFRAYETIALRIRYPKAIVILE